MNEIIQYIKILIIILFFTIAAIKDYKTRKLSKTYWYLPIILATIIITYEIIFLNPSQKNILLNITLGTIIITIMIITNKITKTQIYGKADIKAILFLSIIISGIYTTKIPLLQNYTPQYQINILTILLNTSIIALIIYPTLILYYNIKNQNINRKMLTKIKTKPTKIKNIHGTTQKNKIPAELIQKYTEKNGNNVEEEKLEKFLQQTEWESDNIKEDTKKLQETLKKDYVWITYHIPFLLPLTLGIIITLIIGNILIIFLANII